MPQRCPFLKIFLFFFAKINDRRTTFNCEAWCIVGIWRRGHWTCIWLIFQPKWECWGLWLVWFANIGILWGLFDIFLFTNCIYFQTKWGEQLLPVLDHWTLPQWVPASDNELGGLSRHQIVFITLFIFLTPPSQWVTLSRHTCHVSRGLSLCCDQVTTYLWTVECSWL